MAIWVFQKGCNITKFILIGKEQCVNFAIKCLKLNFKPGDKVRFVHEKGEAKVISVISAYKIRIELSEGLEIDVPANEVALIEKMEIKEIEAITKDVPVKKIKKATSKPHAADEMEIDLHIEELTESYYNMTNAQKLSLQLDRFQEAMEKAIKGHVKKIVFIHGVGNGVLRQSIRDLLKRYNGVQFHDGSFQKYGAGATEVRIVDRSKAK
jgi:dsDNA-specific endonuclease/ATPase MutS2